MRLRPHAPSRPQLPFAPFHPSNIFSRDNTASTRNGDQSEAKKLANQLNYGNPAYAFSGYAGIGWGIPAFGFQTVANIREYATTIFYMPPGYPRRKVLYVDGSLSAQPVGWANNLQAPFNSVPVPDPAAVRSTVVPYESPDTDKQTVIFDLGTGEMWEMFRFKLPYFKPTFQYGGYLASAAAGKGIYPFNAEGTWGAGATSLYALGGTITAQDLVEVLRGGKIKHALCVACPAVKGPAQLPSTRFDAFHNLPALDPEGNPNPAYPEVDAVREGSWFMFPAAAKPSDFGMTGRIEIAIFEAIQTYGLFVNNASGNCSFYVERPATLGTPYSWARVNPWAGYVTDMGLPASLTDWSLPPIDELFSGTASVFAKQPWGQLEQLEPFAS